MGKLITADAVEIEFEKHKSDFEYKKKKSIEGLTKEERLNLWQR